MNALIRWFAANGVAANLLMVLIVAGGLLTLPDLKQEVFPEFSSDRVTVTVEYLGATPEEVEEAICARVEESLQGLSGIKRITSTAIEGQGTVSLELLPGTDVRQVVEQVKARVDAIDTFPEEAEKPVVQEVILRRQVLDIAVSGKADEKSLRLLAERVRDELSALPEISLVELAAARPYEVSIEVSEEALRRHGLTFDQAAQAVRRFSLDLPGGSLKTRGGEILLRTKGQAYRGPEFEALVLMARPDGTVLRLGEVAEVIDGFEDTDEFARFDGEPAILVQVFRVGDQGALDVAEAVHRYLPQARARMPEGVTLTVWHDDTAVLRSRLDLMLRNGRAGLCLVLISLALFLRLQVAFWVALGIPVAFLGAVWLLPALGHSVNLISLFAFIVVLGIVVDDAIIIGENVYTHHQRGKTGLQAAVAGAQEVGVPVLFAVLTTVAAFTPLLFVPGNMGKVMKVVPAIVIATLLVSLVESLLVLPAHLSHLRAAAGEDAGRRLSWRRMQSLFEGLLELNVRRLYQPVLRKCLEWRYLTLAVAFFLFAATVGLVAGRWIKFVFFPPVDADNVVAYLTMPQGTPAEVTAEAVRRLEDSALEALERLRAEARRDEKLYRHVLGTVGGQPFREAQLVRMGRQGSFGGGHLGEVNVELLPSEERDLASTRIAQLWRELTGSIPDALELTFTSSLFSSGEAINVELSSPSIDDLQAAAEKLKETLRGIEGVMDITDSFRPGKQEIQLALREPAATLGLSLADLARQVRQGFYGEEAQRIQRGRDDVRVMVRYPRDERSAIGDLEAMRIRTPAGDEVPFGAVADGWMGRGYAAIQRADRQRTVNVTADADQNVVNANEVMADVLSTVLPELAAEYPGLTWSFEGEQREQRDVLGGLARGFVMALISIYALLAIPFRSYWQPLIVMSAIPLGIAGAIWGHILMGHSLTMLSMFGMVALTGVLVNDSLVLVDFVNRERRRGTPVEEALERAGVQRFRPILLTSLTTFAGLTPLLLERSLQARFLIPMAISLGFGVLFATFVTLLVVPVEYRILQDLRRLWRRTARAHETGRIPISQTAPGFDDARLEEPKNPG